MQIAQTSSNATSGASSVGVVLTEVMGSPQTSPRRRASKAERTYDNLVSSFTIRTAKPWTMVSGYDGQGMAMKVRQTASRGGKRASIPTLPAVNPYTLGARRASANGDRALIESLGLIPNQSFKATKIIQHYPPSTEEVIAIPIEPEAKKQNRSPIGIDRPRSRSEAEACNGKPLTFHSLKFSNTAAKQDTKTSQPQFIVSEYQKQVHPKRKMAPRPETTLEAAQLLLDFTRATK